MAAANIEINSSGSESEMCTETDHTAQTPQNETFLIEHLAMNKNVLCKSQQKDETDVCKEEKLKILTDIYEKSKPTFLSRFGPFLNSEQVEFFEQFKNDPKDGYEISFHLKNLKEVLSKKDKKLKNRRYAALRQLENDSYFSENEMRKRNPLLYEQLVGRYLSASERKLQERSHDEPKSFVGILLDGIETEQVELKRRRQEQAEDAAKEQEEEGEDSYDSDSSSGFIENGTEGASRKRKQREKPSTTLWGEIQDESLPKRIRTPLTDRELSITAQERKLLKEEFVNSMYENFLEGKDEDFDYGAVDNNEEYDNLEIVANDEEEKYFDSEEPEDLAMEEENKANNTKEESSEDELDIYMSALNQHPAVCQLAENMKRL